MLLGYWVTVPRLLSSLALMTTSVFYFGVFVICKPLLIFLSSSSLSPSAVPNCQICFTNRAVIVSLRGTPLLQPSPAVSLNLTWQWAHLVHRWKCIFCKQTHTKAKKAMWPTQTHVGKRPNCQGRCSTSPWFDLTLTWRMTPSSHTHCWYNSVAFCIFVCVCVFPTADSLFDAYFIVRVKLGHERGKNISWLSVDMFVSLQQMNVITYFITFFFTFNNFPFLSSLIVQLQGSFWRPVY